MKVRLANQKMTLELNVTELSPSQMRLIKRINSLVTNILATDDEKDFFESSSDAMKVLAACIKSSNFSTEFTAEEKTPYGKQALEYSVDLLVDELNNEVIVPLDN